MTDAIEGADGTPRPDKPELRAAPSPDDSEPGLQAMVRSEPEPEFAGSEVLVRTAGPVGADGGKVDLTTAGRDIDQSQTANHIGRDMYSARVINNYIRYALAEDEYNEARAEIPLRTSLLDPEELARRAALVVPPDGLDDQVNILSMRRMLVLACAEGMGQSSAAAYLLHKLITRSEGQLADLLVEELAADKDFRWERLLSNQGGPTALIVDLTTMRDLDPEKVVHGLGGLQGELTRSRSYLVLAISKRLGNRVAQAFHGQVHVLQVPSGEHVFRKHLGGTLDVVSVDQLVADAWLAEALRDSFPPRAAEFAVLVKEAVHAGEERIDKLLEQVRYASQDWSEQLRSELAEHPEARWRADLAAAALLEGAPSSAVVEAGRLLRHVSGVEPDPAPRLEWPGSVTALGDLRPASFDALTRRFTRLDFGRSVLSHLWSEHPVIRRDLVDWIDQVPLVWDLTGQDLERLADRVGEMATQVAERGSIEREASAREGARIAIDVARRWAGAGPGGASTLGGSSSRMRSAPGGSRQRSRRSVAVRLLAKSATDPAIGQMVRAQMYDWAYDNAATSLKVVVAEVCGSFGVVYPRSAFTRLKHLAATPAPEVRDAVVASVVQLAAHLGPSRVIDYLLDWFEPPPQARTSALTAILQDAELLRLLTRAGEVRHLVPVGHTVGVANVSAALVTDLWGCILDRMSSEDVATLVRAWLGAVEASSPQRRTALVERLVQAAESDLRRIAQLLYATRRRSAAPTQSDTVDDLFGQLRTRLDEIDPAAWAPGAKDLR
ncbi:hypothetical protein [Actinopolymorpha pittospori]|uniref:LigA protein n=1 Tax=Actinopolymorpha pittospori TaxID=648752 RepID=A0A927N447_9ACTN|nr:hypothetical protein [Actinopolymorpha pittospori]MBE1612321.1 hypothetical protein [Actinopolymorpha pittospori]